MRYFVEDTDKGVIVRACKTVNGELVEVFRSLTKNDQEASQLIKDIKFEYDNGMAE